MIKKFYRCGSYKKSRRTNSPYTIPRITENIIDHKLSNGARVLLKEQQGVDTSIVLAFPYGLANDLHRSHLIEHIIFRSCKGVGGGYVVDRAIEKLGGYYTGYTTEDCMGLVTKFLARNSRKGLELIFNSLTDYKIDPEVLKKEKIIVHGELQERKSDPEFILDEGQNSALFKGHPIYAGKETKKGYNEVTVEELEKIKKLHFGAKNLFIGISGPNIQKLLDDVEEIIGNLPSVGTDIHKFGSQKIERQERNYKEYGVKDNVISIAFPTCGFDNRDTYALDIMTNCLTGSCEEYDTRNRLWFNLREKRGIIYHTRLEHIAGLGIGHVDIRSFGTVKKNTETVKRIMIEELERFITEEIPEEEFIAARDSYLLSTYRKNRLNDVEEIAEELALSGIYGADLTYNENARKIMSLTPRDIKRVARKYLGEGGISIATLTGK